MDSKLRNKEAERETLVRREKRNDPAVQEKEAARETPIRKEKRKDQAVQEQEAARETPTRKDKRKDQAVQKKEAARETPMRKDKRKDQAVQEQEENVHSAYDTSSENVAASDLGIMQYQYEHVTENVSTPDWQKMVLSLNTRQYEVHQFIVEWCSKLLLVHRGLAKPDPFHLFLTGGAGVGKSHLVRTIVQTVNRLFSRNNQSDETHMLVTAPMGAAAYSIAGHTLHSTFLLPVHTHKSGDYMPLSSEKLAVLKQNIGSMKLLVIDEISMVGPDTLLTIHRRLCDVMGNEEHFGGVSILAVGDLLQLPPVAQKPVFDVPNDEMAALFGSLWKISFKSLN